MKTYEGIASDSRHIKPGYIFVAIRGLKLNGEQFIYEAIKNGAQKIVVSNDFMGQIPKGVEVERVDNTRKYLAINSAKLFDDQPENIVAITGTSGKTSTAFFFKQICELLGYKSASIGTLGILSNFAEIDCGDPLTSLDPLTLHERLKKLYDKGITHVAMEASSHGLSQYRLDGVRVKVAAFTNLSQDHLDYHLNMEDYFAAKLRLFSELLIPNGYAIINADIPEAERIIRAIKRDNPTVKILTYGKKSSSIKLVFDDHSHVILEIAGEIYETDYKLSGNFQIHNLMAAIGLCMAVGINASDIIKIVPQIIAAPGRMEKAGEYNGAGIFVDYSHKPDALEKAILSLKPLCKGKLHIIFGCGGDRDALKRPIMGRIAHENADVVYVTDDNPRTEDPAEIRQHILMTCPNAYEESDRAKCIKLAIENLKSGDVLLIAGKGHETYQIIAEEKRHFSDVEEVAKILKGQVPL